jgi:alkyl hydroperoxide reductase subunit F
MFDLIIIGGSAAGSAAAIYAARRNLKFKIVTLDVGGEVALSGTVNNWPGIIEIQGFELAQKFNEHVKSYGVEFDLGHRVEKIISENNIHTVIAKDGAGNEKRYETKTVIIATGIHPRQLGIPGEREFDRKGITYCTVCDGPLFRNKITTTIGSGNSALESAIMMAGISKKVYLISKYNNIKEENYGFPKGENILIEKLKDLANVEVIYGANTTEITGDKTVGGLKYTDAEGEKTIETQGVMVHIGQIPNSQFTEGINKNKVNEIMVDAKCQTNVPGIFAAGDVTDVAYKQIGISTGQGITAALAAIEYINRF